MQYLGPHRSTISLQRYSLEFQFHWEDLRRAAIRALLVLALHHGQGGTDPKRAEDVLARLGVFVERHLNRYRARKSTLHREHELFDGTPCASRRVHNTNLKIGT